MIEVTTASCSSSLDASMKKTRISCRDQTSGAFHECCWVPEAPRMVAGGGARLGEREPPVGAPKPTTMLRPGRDAGSRCMVHCRRTGHRPFPASLPGRLDECMARSPCSGGCHHRLPAIMPPAWSSTHQLFWSESLRSGADREEVCGCWRAKGLILSTLWAERGYPLGWS